MMEHVREICDAIAERADMLCVPLVLIAFWMLLGWGFLPWWGFLPAVGVLVSMLELARSLEYDGCDRLWRGLAFLFAAVQTLTLILGV